MTDLNTVTTQFLITLSKAYDFQVQNVLKLQNNRAQYDYKKK